jgi:hypothetical protein
LTTGQEGHALGKPGKRVLQHRGRHAILRQQRWAALGVAKRVLQRFGPRRMTHQETRGEGEKRAPTWQWLERRLTRYPVAPGLCTTHHGLHARGNADTRATTGGLHTCWRV